MKKRLLALLLAGTMMWAVSACSDPEGGESGSPAAGLRSPHTLK